MYITTNTEDFTKCLLHSLQIYTTDQLHMKYIAKQLNIKIKKWEFSSEAVMRNKKAIIFLKEDLSSPKMRMDFSHELAHVLRHAGNQTYMPLDFIRYQEWDARSFSYHLCVPTFMLSEMELPFHWREAAELVADTFNVTIPFASERLRRYENQIIDSRNYEKGNNLYHY